MNEKRLWLIEARTLKNMSRLQLAKATGVNHTYIAKIENGERTPSHQVVIRMSKILNIPENEALLRFYSSKSA